MKCKDRKHFYSFIKLAQPWKVSLIKCFVQALMLKSKGRFLKAKTEVIKKQKREENGEGWETIEGTPRSEQKKQEDLSMSEQISTLQAMDDAMSEQLGIFWTYCSPWRAHTGADFFPWRDCSWWRRPALEQWKGIRQKQNQRETELY